MLASSATVMFVALCSNGSFSFGSGQGSMSMDVTGVERWFNSSQLNFYSVGQVQHFVGCCSFLVQ